MAFDIKNYDKFKRAEKAIDTYCVVSGNPVRTFPSDLTDLLADLMHYADRNQFSFEGCLGLAKEQYNEDVKINPKDTLI